MRTVKITIKSLFGISAQELGDRSVEIKGKKGVGKTSVIDAIRFALTHRTERDWIIKDGANEGEIIIETDSGLMIDRKVRSGKADYIAVKDNRTTVTKPESFLNTIVTPLQLNPVEFTQMSKADQNRAILDLIEFDWDMEWIREKFGEIPQGVDYSQNILQILNDIQSDKGAYFLSRQDINREIRNKRAFVSDIAKYAELMKRRDNNSRIERAKAFRDSYNNKLRGLEANREISITAAQQAIGTERDNLNRLIAEREAEIRAAREKLASLDAKLDDKKKVAQAEFETAKAKLDRDTGVAEQYMNLTPEPTEELADEIRTAEAMIKHLNEYDRMTAMQAELDGLKAKSDEYTEKIELARSLPAEILETATLPIEGLTVENGIPLIHGLPVSNRSDGEKLELCVDIAVHNPAGLKIILIDGAEKLDDESRERLYQRCREKGLQFIATRTTNDNELIVTEF